LLGAHIGGVLDFGAATLRPVAGLSLHADRLYVEQNMICPAGFRATGEVRLRGARIDGQLAFFGASLGGRDTDPQQAQGADDPQQAQGADDPQQAQGAESDVALDLEDADVGVLILEFAERPTRPINLRFARLRVLADRSYGTDQKWAKCRLDGCSYDRLVPSTPVSVKQRLTWLPRERSEYTPQPYNQLAGAYRNTGHELEARRVAIENQRQRRRALPWWHPARVWSLIFGATVAHGYRLWQAGVWLILLVGLGSLLFGEVFCTTTEDSCKDDDLAPAKRVEDVAPFHPIMYSVDLLIPVISLGQRTGWNAHSTAAQWVAFGFTIVGWLLTASFAAGVVARRQ
jgi:hypothetical protein